MHHKYIVMRAVDDVRQSKCNLIFTLIGDNKKEVTYTARMVSLEYLYRFYHNQGQYSCLRRCGTH